MGINRNKERFLRSGRAFCKVGVWMERERGARHGIGEPMIVGNERCRSDHLEGGRQRGGGGKEGRSPTSLVCCRCLDHAITSATTSSRCSLSSTHTIVERKATELQSRTEGYGDIQKVQRVREQA